MDSLLPLAEKIGARLKERGETIAIAESSTGGLISAALLSIGGASAYFRGGSVIYTAYARAGFLDIPNPLPAPIERASTEPYALLLADTVKVRLESSWGRRGRRVRRAIVTGTRQGTPASRSPGRGFPKRSHWKPAATTGSPICGRSGCGRWSCWRKRWGEAGRVGSGRGLTL